jgi:hypothetical protein
METDAKNAGARNARRSTTDDPRIVYTPREGATPEGETSALAAVYAFVLKCHEQKMAAGGGDGENTAEGDHVGESPEQFTAREGGS